MRWNIQDVLRKTAHAITLLFMTQMKKSIQETKFKKKPIIFFIDFVFF
jgi:hypothetical protein